MMMNNLAWSRLEAGRTDKLVAALETVALAIDEGTLKPVRVDEHTMLVLRHPGRLSDKAQAHIKAYFAMAFPGRKIVVLEEGMDITALDCITNVYRSGPYVQAGTGPTRR